MKSLKFNTIHRANFERIKKIITNPLIFYNYLKNHITTIKFIKGLNIFEVGTEMEICFDDVFYFTAKVDRINETEYEYSNFLSIHMKYPVEANIKVVYSLLKVTEDNSCVVILSLNMEDNDDICYEIMENIITQEVIDNMICMFDDYLEHDLKNHYQIESAVIENCNISRIWNIITNWEKLQKFDDSLPKLLTAQDSSIIFKDLLFETYSDGNSSISSQLFSSTKEDILKYEKKIENNFKDKENINILNNLKLNSNQNSISNVNNYECKSSSKKSDESFIVYFSNEDGKNEYCKLTVANSEISNNKRSYILNCYGTLGTELQNIISMKILFSLIEIKDKTFLEINHIFNLPIDCEVTLKVSENKKNLLKNILSNFKSLK